MTKKTLFEISNELLELQDLLEQVEGDKEQEDKIHEFLADSTGDLNEKLDNYAELIKEREVRAQALSVRAEEMSKLAQTEFNLVKRLKSSLLYFLGQHGMASIETDRHKISICKNGGTLPVTLALDLDPSRLSNEFQKVTIKPDTEAIRDALAEGRELGFASLGQRGSHIRIR